MEIETLNQALILAINEAANAAEFIKGELPEVVRQLLTWKLWTHGISTAICAFFAFVLPIVCARFFLKEGKRGKWGNECNPAIMVPCGFVGLLSFIVGFIEFSMAMPKFIQILVAPKVYLLEYAANLVG